MARFRPPLDTYATLSLSLPARRSMGHTVKAYDGPATCLYSRRDDADGGAAPTQRLPPTVVFDDRIAIAPAVPDPRVWLSETPTRCPTGHLRETTTQAKPPMRKHRGLEAVRPKGSNPLRFCREVCSRRSYDRVRIRIIASLVKPVKSGCGWRTTTLPAFVSPCTSCP